MFNYYCDICGVNLERNPIIAHVEIISTLPQLDENDRYDFCPKCMELIKAQIEKERNVHDFANKVSKQVVDFLKGVKDGVEDV